MTVLAVDTVHLNGGDPSVDVNSFLSEIEISDTGINSVHKRVLSSFFKILYHLIAKPKVRFVISIQAGIWFLSFA